VLHYNAAFPKLRDSNATAQFAKGISMAHACSSELQPAIADVLPSIAQTILSKVGLPTKY
jgi:hypothetical protein